MKNRNISRIQRAYSSISLDRVSALCDVDLNLVSQCLCEPLYEELRRGQQQHSHITDLCLCVLDVSNDLHWRLSSTSPGYCEPVAPASDSLQLLSIQQVHDLTHYALKMEQD